MIEAEHGHGEKTIIVISGNTAEVWTSVPHTARKLDRLCNEHPDSFKLTKTHRYGDGRFEGKIDWKLYEAAADTIIIKEDYKDELDQAS